jgi:hypothetical protein
MLPDELWLSGRRDVKNKKIRVLVVAEIWQMWSTECLDQRGDRIAVLNNQYFPTAMAKYGGSGAVSIPDASDVQNLRRNAYLLCQRRSRLLSAFELSGENRSHARCGES